MNKEQKKAYDKAYREANKDKIKAYREANKEQKKAIDKAYREANKDKIKAYLKTNKDKIYEKRKEYINMYQKSNKEKIQNYSKVYREVNKEKLRKDALDRYHTNKNNYKNRMNKYSRIFYKKSRTVDKWNYVLYKSCLQRNKKYNCDVDFDDNYISQLYEKQNGLCGYFKIPMIVSLEYRHPFKPSIDRMDSTKGYTKDNIVLCCLMANFGKSSCTYEEWMECLNELEIKKKCSMENERWL